jgi:outer membrane receptor protein involved in Fe transport
VHEPPQEASHRYASRCSRSASALLASLVLVPPLALSAAEQPDAAAAAGDAAQSTIVVTARRRAEVLQDVPIAIAVLDADALVAAGATDAMQLQTVVASLTYPATGYAAQPYLRSVSSRRSRPISTTATCRAPLPRRSTSSTSSASRC